MGIADDSEYLGSNRFIRAANESAAARRISKEL
jgi:hypothetical protein